MSLAPHEQRVVDEHAALISKIDRLEAFLKTDYFRGLQKVEQDLLVEQTHHMCGYASVLDSRIKLFKGVNV